MKSFTHVNAESVSSAVRSLEQNPGARPIAGGTDLLSELKQGIVAPDRLVNLKSIPDLVGIRFDEASGLHIGALATLSSIAEHDIVLKRYHLLAEAISSAASPQLRNRGTIGGNLCQDSRCWYYRGHFHCWLKGGAICNAKDGENAHHAIFGGGPCYTAHPSDPAPALLALGAEVRLIGPNGERTLPLDQLFQRPNENSRRLTVLDPAEIVVEISVPAAGVNERGKYLKAMERQAWAFALASLAVQLTVVDDTVSTARLVLGGVAPTPWRLDDAETALIGKQLSDTTIAAIADLAVAGAQPLRQNGYKVSLVKGIVHDALSSLRTPR